MKSRYLYLSVIPEALVASMLPPEEFGRYLSVGTHKRSQGEALYFEVDPSFSDPFFKMDLLNDRCVSHPDGTPKHSLYLGIYRALEHIPLNALGKLYLTTRDGRVLTLKKSEVPTGFDDAHYLYNELCPVRPLIASSLDPSAFTQFATRPDSPLCIPRIFFARLNADKLIASEPSYSNSLINFSERISDAFAELDSTDKRTKTVDRMHQRLLPWNHIQNGYFVGDPSGLIYYPFPSQRELEIDHHLWWRSSTL